MLEDTISALIYSDDYDWIEYNWTAYEPGYYYFELRLYDENNNLEEEYKSKLDNYRSQIDVFDQNILEIIAKRMKISNEIGSLKKTKNVAVLQNKRWKEVLEKMVIEGKEKDLSSEFTRKIFKAIHQESINHQEKIINS